jgi:ElaB/YqjD/DUF883 family membrane-anchored ribosome-binding protein
MKRNFKFFGIIMILPFVLFACNTQTSRNETRNNLSNLSEEMQDVVQTIDEAIAVNDISEFENKTEDAVNSLDKKIDDYLDEMDKAERRIERNTQNLVIDMKKKSAEVEFKLALLDQDDDRVWNQDEAQPDGSGMQTSQRNITSDGSVSAAQADRTVAGNRTAEDEGTTDRDRTRLYGSNMVEDIKEDLRELKSDVDQFMQTSLAYQETE